MGVGRLVGAEVMGTGGVVVGGVGVLLVGRTGRCNGSVGYKLVRLGAGSEEG